MTPSGSRRTTGRPSKMSESVVKWNIGCYEVHYVSSPCSVRASNAFLAAALTRVMRAAVYLYQVTGITFFSNLSYPGCVSIR